MPQVTDKPILNERFRQAIRLALELHHKQLRKRAKNPKGATEGPEIPYVSHLLIVAGTVLEYGGTEVEAAAALLHDAVEDQGGLPTLERIRAEVGAEVAEIVRGCSDSVVQEAEGKEDWRDRKERYLTHLGEASESVLLVSIADKLHNCNAAIRDLRSEGDRIWDRFNASKDNQLWYYRSLARVASHRGKGTRAQNLARDLGRAVAELEREA